MMIRERPQSAALFNDSCKLMPGGVNSPVRSFSSFSMTPMLVERGKGDTIWDVDGHSYIDFCCSWGSLILGHAQEEIVKSAFAQMQRGSSFGIATPYEKLLAEKILKHFPSMEKIRFVSSGTEATMTALRLARAFTKRSVIVKFNGHYHGHSDSLLIKAGSGVTHLPESSSHGIPEEVIRNTVSLPFNDSELCRTFLRSRDDIAAVILEPIAGNMGLVPATPSFMDMLREETEKKGILLIYDEVITGFRAGLKGAQDLYGITPDLTCLGKVIGGGFPAAAFGGSQEIMDMIAPLGPVYQAGTLSGNPVAMCAGYSTLEQLEAPGFYETLEKRTADFLAPIQERARDLNMCINHRGSMFSLFFGVKSVNSREDLNSFDEQKFKELFYHLFNHGIYFSPSAYEAHFLSSAHTDESLAYAQKIILDFLN